MNWYALEAKQHRERLAQIHLGRRGVATYVPLIEEWPPPAVGSPVRPMFPGYVFAELELPEDYYKAIWTPGVKGVVTCDVEPAVLPGAVVEYLREQEDSDGVIRPLGQRERGRAVRVARGPFKGLHAIIERRVPSRERVLVLLRMLEREMPVEMPESWLRQA